MRNVKITVEEALAAVRAAAWTEDPKPEAATCGHRGCLDHPGEGRRMIHVLSGFGMDLPLETVEEEIRQSREVAWMQSLFGHDLAALTTEGHLHQYEVRMPGHIRDQFATAQAES